MENIYSVIFNNTSVTYFPQKYEAASCIEPSSQILTQPLKIPCYYKYYFILQFRI